MKALKLLVIVVLCVVNHSCSQKRDTFPVGKDQSYYYKTDNRLGESIIVFRNDLIFIIETPPIKLIVGDGTYRVGKFKINQDSTIIECDIHKTILYSFNIGSIMGYTKDCHDIVTLEISQQGELIRTLNGGKWALKYKKSDSKNSSFPESMTQWIEQYEDLSKRRACN